jgi:hypothetical protein
MARDAEERLMDTRTSRPSFRLRVGELDGDDVLEAAFRGPYTTDWTCVLMDGHVLEMLAGSAADRASALERIGREVEAALRSVWQRHATGLPCCGDYNADRTAVAVAVNYETREVEWKALAQESA